MADKSSSEHLRVTIFIPTLNEIEGLRAILPRIDPACYDEIIVVDGGSTDGTVEFLQSQGVTVQHEERKGVVNAYCQGFRASTGDIFVTIQGDGNCKPELIPDLVREARKGYDIVFVSRYKPPARSYDDGTLTAFGNHMFTRAINLFFGGKYTDALGGFRAYKRSAVHAMALDEMPDTNWLTRRYDLLNSWEIGACARAAKLKLNVREIAGDEPKRIGGKSKVSVIRNGLMALSQILLEVWIGRRFASSALPAPSARPVAALDDSDRVVRVRSGS